MTWSADQQRSIQAIIYWGKQYHYSDNAIQFMIAVAIGESNLNPFAKGDYQNGAYHSFGIYQFLDEWNGQHGRGYGYSQAQREDPYFEAKIDLPILYQQYLKYGGDAHWASDPYSVLKYAWKYGQGSQWPSDGQLKDALSSLSTIDVANFQYDPSKAPTQTLTTDPPQQPPQDSFQIPQAFSFASLFPPEPFNVFAPIGGDQGLSPPDYFGQGLFAPLPGLPSPDQMNSGSPPLSFADYLNQQLFAPFG